jgi:zinc/manganese transport system permease protein
MTNPAFSLNIVSDLRDMWQYAFMQHAFEAGTLVAVVAGVIGYFVVLRRSSFAAHGLSHAGFTGAAGAVLLGINPIFGLFVFTMGGALLMAALGKRAVNRDVQIGVVLSFMLGLGLLFVSLYRGGYSSEAYSILFGQILGINAVDVWVTLGTSALVLVVFAALYRPLLFTSLDEEVAEARGMPVFGMGLAFMLLVAAATSIAVQVVGVLLIFSLMVAPAAVAQRIARRPEQGIGLAVAIALLSTWLGLFLAYYLPYPVSFFITTITFIIYIAARLRFGRPYA